MGGVTCSGDEHSGTAVCVVTVRTLQFGNGSGLCHKVNCCLGEFL